MHVSENWIGNMKNSITKTLIMVCTINMPIIRERIKKKRKRKGSRMKKLSKMRTLIKMMF